jgi:hypothetical protein
MGFHPVHIGRLDSGWDRAVYYHAIDELDLARVSLVSEDPLTAAAVVTVDRLTAFNVVEKLVELSLSVGDAQLGVSVAVESHLSLGDRLVFRLVSGSPDARLSVGLVLT